jgi:uncharacterized protein
MDEDWEDDPDGPNSSDRTLATLAHVGGFFTAYIVPIIFWLNQVDRKGFVATHAKESLNFQITLTFYYLACLVPGGVAYYLLVDDGEKTAFLTGVLVCLAASVVVCVYELAGVILAGVAAYQGRSYRIPLNIRLV